MTEKLKPFTKKDYEWFKRELEKAGFIVKTKYRKGLKYISLGDIVLSEGEK